MTYVEFLYTVLLRSRPLRCGVNALMKRILPPVLRVGNARVRINPQDPVVSGTLALKVYENAEIAFFSVTSNRT